MDDTLGKDKSLETLDKLKQETEKVICDILEEGINMSNIELLDKVVDIHKDIANEEYWCKKEEIMMYRDDRYSDYPSMNYGGGRRRDSRGRYMANGRDRRYRGHDIIDDMYDSYSNYMGDREEMNRGNYGAKDDTMKSLEYMLESVVDFVEMLKKDTNSQEEMDLIRKYTREISEM